jgi:hypothetical protein
MNWSQLKDVPSWAVVPAAIALLGWALLPKLFPFFKEWLKHKRAQAKTPPQNNSSNRLPSQTQPGKDFPLRVVRVVVFALDSLLVLGGAWLLWSNRHSPAPATVGDVAFCSLLVAGIIAAALRGSGH